MKYTVFNKTLILTALLLILSATGAFAVDPPHDNVSSCNSCHNFLTGVGSGGSIDNTPNNTLCATCHKVGAGGVKPKKTHSSTTTGSEATYGPWVTECVDCHDPHDQQGMRKYKTDYSAGGSYLASGLIASFKTNGGISNVLVATTNPGWTVNKWAGYILLPNASRSNYYKIVNSSSNSLTTALAIKQGLLYARVGNTFKIGYGLLIKEQVRAPRGIINSAGYTWSTNRYRNVEYVNTAGPHSAAYTINDTLAICVVCHTRTKAFNIGYATYGQPYDGTTEYANHPHKNNVSSTSACWGNATACHKPPKEGFDANCGGCHAAPPVDAAGLINNPTATGRASAGKHQQHSDKSIVECELCHKGSREGTDTHTAAVKFNIGFSRGLYQGDYTAPVMSGTYTFVAATNTTVNTGANRTCTNIYCHSNGSNYAGTYTYRTVDWDTGSALACDKCHGNLAGTYVTTDTHPVHISGNYSFKCYECHGQTVDSGNAIISQANHVNGAKNVSFGNISAGGTYTRPNCSSVYCHSDGKGGAPGTTPTWATTMTGCIDCHDEAGATTTLSGAHAAHTAAGGIQSGCADCHSTTVSNNTTISNYSLHVNKVKNVRVSAGKGGDGNDYASNSCATTNCHGSVSDSWSTDNTGIDSCTKCHGEKSASPTEAQKAPGGLGRDTNDDTAASDAQVGAHQAHMTAPSGYSSPIACTSCHTVPAMVNSTGHIDTALPAELTFSSFVANYGGLTPSYAGGVCSSTYCHGAKMPNASNNGSDTTPGWTETTYLSGTRTAAADCGKCHGAPPTGYTPSSHGGSETIAQCTSCHDHVDNTGAFVNASMHIDGTVQASGCTGCHGQPPITDITMVNTVASLGITGRTAQFSGTAPGKHDKHVNVKGYDCTYCHNGGGSGGQHNGGSPTEVTMGFKINAVTGGVYNAPDFSDADYNVGDDGITVSTMTGSTRVCSSIYCHSNGKDYAGAFTYATPNWDGANYSYPADCNKCHGDATNKVITDKHPKHVATYGYNCQLCHSGTVNGSFGIIGNHVNYAKNVDFFSGSTLSTGGNYTRPNCTTVYCHSDGAGGVPATTAAWNYGGSLTCTSCHKGNLASGSPMTRGRHYTHIANTPAVGRQLGCAECHNDTVSTGSDTAIGAGKIANHVNGTKNIKVKIDGTACSNIKCHSNGNLDGTPTYNNPNWYSGSLGCANCHGNGTVIYPNYADGGQGTGASNSHNKHVATSSLACRECHSLTAGASTVAGTTVINGTVPAAHVNQIANVIFYQGGSMNGSEQCSATYCHGAGTPTWGGASLACNACHNANNVLQGKHAKHYGTATLATSRTAANNSSTTAYIFNCGTCHDNTNHAKGQVSVDQAAEVILNGTVAGGGTYAAGALAGTDTGGREWTNGTCSTTYCHSQGKSTTSPFGGAPNTAATWNGGAMNCEGCHNYNAAATNKMNSNRHTSHINNSTALGTNYGCQECHNTTTSDGTTITNESLHVNKARNVSMPKGGTWGTPNCTSTYCHSSGQATPTYVNRAWDTTTVLDCKGCHGTGSSVYGEPDYANGGAGTATANSHSAHVSAASDCDKCHTDTTTTGTSIKAASTLHTDQTRNVNFKATYDDNGGTNSDNYDGTAGNKYCSSITCHGAGTPQWGGSVTCNSCHSAADNDVDDYVYNNGTTAVINSTHWASSGHGRDTGSGNYPVSNNPPADLTDCTYCHTSGVGHGVSTNPFRLSNTGGGDGPNGNCLICHKTGSAGYDPDGGGALPSKNRTTSPAVDKYHYMQKHIDRSANGGRFCWDCHDPHGDGSNIMMIHAKAVKQTDGTYGNPGALSNLTGPNSIVFTDNTKGTGAGGFAINTTGSNPEQGVCNACHVRKAADPGKMVHYYNASPNSDDNHNQGVVCTVCHAHSGNATVNGEAFKGGGCNGCHGYPPDPDIDGAGPDTNDGKAYIGTAQEGKGAHPEHVTHLLARTGYTLDPNADQFTGVKVTAVCGVCHDTSSDSNHTTDGSAPDSRQIAIPTSYKFGASNPAYNGLPSTSSTVNMKSCSNVSCHFKESPGWQDPATSGQ